MSSLDDLRTYGRLDRVDGEVRYCIGMPSLSCWSAAVFLRHFM